MLDRLKIKFSKLKKKDSIVQKLDSIRNSNQHSNSPYYTPDGQPVASEIGFDASKIAQMHEETEKKISDMLDSKAETINANVESIKTIENRLSKMDITISTIKRNIDEYEERFNKMEENILELLSLYEVVSNTVNPFVGDNENNPANLERFNLIENRVNKLEDSIEHLMNNVNSITASVSDDALQQIRIEFDEKLKELDEKLNELHSKNESDSRIDEEKDIVDNPDAEQPDHKPTNEQRRHSKSENSPLLEFINNDYETSIVLLNWVEFLMEKVGRNNLMDVLDYYTDIGWISESVSNKIMAYASGIDYYDEKPTWKLMPQDHTKSLMFIERLRGRRIDMGAFHKIERDVEKVKHHSEPYFEV